MTEYNHRNEETENMNDEVNDTDKLKKKHKNFAREALSWVAYIGIVVVASLLIVSFVAQRTEVMGSSMYPTLVEGDQLIVEKVSYHFTDPKRFDVIVFPYPEDPSVHYIKRIIGLPGETVQISGETIYINGEPLEEDFGTSEMGTAGIAAEPITLGDDEYFVLGDNRSVSKDSRYESVGNIHKDDITGKAWLRIWPLNKIGFLKHQ